MRQLTRRDLVKTAAAGAGTLACRETARAQDGKGRLRVKELSRRENINSAVLQLAGGSAIGAATRPHRNS